MSMTTRYTTVNGEVIAEKGNGIRRLYVPDPLGSTVALLDNTQTQTDTFTYWPYGESTHVTGSTPTPFQFVGTLGYYQNSATTTYVRARILDTQKGRWLSQDPIGFDSGSYNFMQYGDNSPVSFSDPTGLDPINIHLCGWWQPPAPPAPKWPQPPGNQPQWPVDDCPSMGPREHVPVHTAESECMACCVRVFGKTDPKATHDCQVCCSQWNNRQKGFPHCQGAWPKQRWLPGMPPRGCPPGKYWDPNYHGKGMCVTPCTGLLKDDGNGGCTYFKLSL
jgi:RHS repeat-associated protein